VRSSINRIASSPLRLFRDSDSSTSLLNFLLVPFSVYSIGATSSEFLSRRRGLCTYQPTPFFLVRFLLLFEKIPSSLVMTKAPFNPCIPSIPYFWNSSGWSAAVIVRRRFDAFYVFTILYIHSFDAAAPGPVRQGIFQDAQRPLGIWSAFLLCLTRGFL